MKISEIAKYDFKKIEQFQEKKLAEILPGIIANTPAFESFKHIITEITEENAIQLLKTLPFTSKQDVLMNLTNYLRTDFDERSYDVRTGGTSGEILSFPRKNQNTMLKNYISNIVGILWELNWVLTRELYSPQDLQKKVMTDFLISITIRCFG
jgi:phenylacetate-coenzyme A ligase PaaK-like adenylate-forming protein